jgi:RHS repeat-associated protein
VTTYSYDNLGNLASTTNPANQKVSYTYDDLGNLSSTTDPLGHVTQYSHDASGLVTSIVDRNGNETNYSYDADGRLTKSIFSDGSANSYNYDGFGDMTAAANSTETLGFTYDQAGEITSSTAAPTSSGDPGPSVTLHYTYDAAGEPTSVAGPAGTISYGYNPNALLNQVTDPTGGVFGITHDANGREIGLSRPNGVSDTTTYDVAGDVTAIASVTSNGSNLAFDDYAYTANGLRATLDNGDGSTAYSYDADGQLTSASYPSASGLSNESFSYDAAGNQIESSQAYDGAGRITADSANSYTFDKDGQLTTRTVTKTGKTTHYSWNANHQLVAVAAPDGSQTTYSYDPLGRRVSVTTAAGRTYTVYDGLNPIATYDGAGNLTASYVHDGSSSKLLEETAGGASYYYLEDALGSVTALTNASGAIVDSYRYSAFGGVHATGTTSNAFTYIGTPTDPSTGLVYLQTRYLDPTTGRFLSEDPVADSTPYGYSLNSPTNLSDPTGRDSLEEEGAAEDVEGTLEGTSDDEALDILRNTLSSALREFAGEAAEDLDDIAEALTQQFTSDLAEDAALRAGAQELTGVAAEAEEFSEESPATILEVLTDEDVVQDLSDATNTLSYTTVVPEGPGGLGSVLAQHVPPDLLGNLVLVGSVVGAIIKYIASGGGG